MDDLSRMSDVEGDADADGDVAVAVIDGRRAWPAGQPGSDAVRSPAPKSRSLSDGAGTGTPKLSPSPYIVGPTRRQSKDDIAIRDKDRERMPSPSTPVRAAFAPAASRGLSLQMPHQQDAPSQSGYARPAPPSPKHEHAHPYASPTNILPRRSRGMDFSRAATSLHHSTLADQASPDSSPTIGSRAMNIPGRRAADYGSAEQTSTSLWSMMGSQERMHISGSAGSTSHAMAMSDLSSSSDDDDYMDEDMEEPYVTTPQVQKTAMPGPSAAAMGAPWMPGSPAPNNLWSFQQRQRQRQRKHPKKKPRGPLLGFHSPAASAITSKSPPNNLIGPMDMSPHARRESISWAANQLHISGNESDDSHGRHADAAETPSRPSIVRRSVTRRGNLLVRLLSPECKTRILTFAAQNQGVCPYPRRSCGRGRTHRIRIPAGSRSRPPGPRERHGPRAEVSSAPVVGIHGPVQPHHGNARRPR